MKRYPLRLAMVAIVGILVLLAACTSASSSATSSESFAVKIGPVTFQLPNVKPADVKTTMTDTPAINDAKIFDQTVAPAEQVKPTNQAKDFEQTKATDLSQYMVGEMCHPGH